MEGRPANLSLGGGAGCLPAFGLSAFQACSVGLCFHKVVAAVLMFLLDTDSL